MFLADCLFINRHVTLPKDTLKVIPKDYFDTETGTLRILQEEEWRSLGITQVPSSYMNTTLTRQSVGWQHYETHGNLLLKF